MGQAWYWVKRTIEQNGECFFRFQDVTVEFWDEVDKDTGYWLSENQLCRKRYSATKREQYYENRMIWLIEKAQQGAAFAQFGLGCELSDINDNLGTLFSENWQLVICEELLHQQATIATDEPIDWGKLAMFWLTKAAEQGFWAAQKSLDEVYYTGQLGVGIDYKKALYWGRKLAERGLSLGYFCGIEKFNATNEADGSKAPKFTLEDLEHYRLNNQDSI